MFSDYRKPGDEMKTYSVVWNTEKPENRLNYEANVRACVWCSYFFVLLFHHFLDFLFSFHVLVSVIAASGHLMSTNETWRADFFYFILFFKDNYHIFVLIIFNTQ